MYRFGKGFTLQVKIGSPDDFVGAVSEPIQLRGRRGGSRFGSRTGSRLGGSFTRQTSTEVPTSPKSPFSEPPAQDDSSDSPVNKFHKFVKETFENTTLIEEHQV